MLLLATVSLPMVEGAGWVLPVIAVILFIATLRWVRSWFF